MKSLTFSLITLLMAGFIMAFVVPQTQKKGGAWNIPEKYQKMTNPHAGNAELVKIGKMAYAKHCKSCHGATGVGDGPKAKQLETFPGDFTSADFHKMSDGEMFYKSIIGRDEMPNYESKIPDDEERWALILYMRSEFKK